jgi:hypothetical protein
MQSKFICISCTAFVMDMLKVHQGSANINLQIGGTPTDLFAAVRCCLKEMGIFMPPTHLLCQM